MDCDLPLRKEVDECYGSQCRRARRLLRSWWKASWSVSGPRNWSSPGSRHRSVRGPSGADHRSHRNAIYRRRRPPRFGRSCSAKGAFFRTACPMTEVNCVGDHRKIEAACMRGAMLPALLLVLAATVAKAAPAGTAAADLARCGGNGAKAESSSADRESKHGSDPGKSDRGALGAVAAGQPRGVRSGAAREPGSVPGHASCRFPGTFRAVLAVPGRLQRFGAIV